VNANYKKVARILVNIKPKYYGKGWTYNERLGSRMKAKEKIKHWSKVIIPVERSLVSTRYSLFHVDPAIMDIVIKKLKLIL
jgi:hypothetical protein